MINSVTQVAMKLVVGCLTVMLAVIKFGIQAGVKLVRTSNDDEQGAVEDIELGMNQTVVSNEVERSTVPEPRIEKCAVTSNNSTLTVASAITAASFTAIFAVLESVNEVGRAVKGNTDAFIMFVVTDMLAFHALLVAVMIEATVSDLFANISLWAVAVFFTLTFHATAYVVVLPNQEWIVLCFGGAATIELALFLLYRLSNVFY